MFCLHVLTCNPISLPRREFIDEHNQGMGKAGVWLTQSSESRAYGAIWSLFFLLLSVCWFYSFSLAFSTSSNNSH